jgi:hypothetical protein
MTFPLLALNSKFNLNYLIFKGIFEGFVNKYGCLETSGQATIRSKTSIQRPKGARQEAKLTYSYFTFEEPVFVLPELESRNFFFSSVSRFRIFFSG